METTRPIRVCLIEDHLVIRAGLHMLLNAQPDMEVVGEAAGREDALKVAAENCPNLFVADVHLGHETVSDFLGELLEKTPGSHAILLTAITEEDQLHRAIAAGAAGLVYKDEDADVLMRAIRKVHGGEVWLGRTMTAAVLSKLSRAHAIRQAEDPEVDKIASLTRREREVVSLVASGLNRERIAEKLFVSEATVRNHLTSILAKLDLESRFELVFYAQQHGLIQNAKRAG